MKSFLVLVKCLSLSIQKEWKEIKKIIRLPSFMFPEHSLKTDLNRSINPVLLRKWTRFTPNI